ncbi:hypothetical protein [Streptomyces globisporus]|uniref:hypothetical protein n=1 Tax=Streptomyces globisporus TaxID=1908 RepID=UPI0004C545E9|nr:hypothetical protein [Streptomyces globisporus]
MGAGADGRLSGRPTSMRRCSAGALPRRWLAYGYETALHDGKLGSPVGVAELLQPLTHGDPDA